jgi:hypothetical protein
MYAAVGELILLASALDHQLNRACIVLLALPHSPVLESLVASIDATRKLEIVKSCAAEVQEPSWRKALKKHAELVEEVNRRRNVAAHGTMMMDEGRWVLFSPTVPKILRSINAIKQSKDRLYAEDVEESVRKGNEALSSGQLMLTNLDRLQAERAKRGRAGQPR